MTSAITSFLVTVEDKIEDAGAAVVTEAKSVLASVENVYVSDVKPEVSNLVQKIIPDEVAVLTPYAQQAFTEIVEDIPAFLTGGIEAFVAAVGPLLASTFAKATAAGISVAKTDALTAVTAVVADAKADLVASAAPADTAIVQAATTEAVVQDTTEETVSSTSGAPSASTETN